VYWNEFSQYSEPLGSTYSTHPAYDEYPVVNISQDGAKLFCEWLTEKYNTIPKRKFKKVVFRLPTEAEWISAARAGRTEAPFPWGGYYVRNGKGQFLANFKRVSQTQIKRDPITNQPVIATDTGLKINTSIVRLPAPVKSYYPNDFGLYQMSGNAAEMLAETGRTKGGSWNSYGYHIQIDAEDEYEGFTKPSPMIGFRYFMEVLEN